MQIVYGGVVASISVERGEYSDGVVAASLSTLVAANAKGNFLEARGVMIYSMTTAALAFLITTFNAALKARVLRWPGRNLKLSLPATALMRSFPKNIWAKPRVRGIEILNQFDSKKSGS